MERQIRGIPASPGIVVGHAHLLRWEVPDVRHRIVPDEGIAAEIDHFRAAVAGIAIPLAAARVVGSDGLLLDGALGAGALIAVGLVRVHGRVEGWKLVLVLIAVFALVSVIR